MAEKSEKPLERTYIIPLRRHYVKTQPYLRAKKSMSLIRAFLKKHMKSEDIKLGKELNELVWARGGKKVPGKVTVLAKKEGETVTANLVGIVKKEKPIKKKAEKKETKKTEEKKETGAKEQEKSEE